MKRQQSGRTRASQAKPSTQRFTVPSRQNPNPLTSNPIPSHRPELQCYSFSGSEWTLTFDITGTPQLCENASFIGAHDAHWLMVTIQGFPVPYWSAWFFVCSSVLVLYVAVVGFQHCTHIIFVGGMALHNMPNKPHYW